MPAIATTSMNHQGYEARVPKDAIKSESFGIWLPDNEGLDIKNVLELVDRCNLDIHLGDIRVKYSAKGSDGMPHVVAVQEPSLDSLEEWDWAPFAGCRRVQFQKRNVKKAQCPEVPTEVQTNVVTQMETEVENVRVASEGAEEPQIPDQGSKASSSD